VAFGDISHGNEAHLSPREEVENVTDLACDAKAHRQRSVLVDNDRPIMLAVHVAHIERPETVALLIHENEPLRKARRDERVRR
jgi:hypothetical protein